MAAILEQLLIKNRSDPNSPKVIQRNAILCSVVSIILNLPLFGGKLMAGTVSRSVAVTIDAINNLADAGTCGEELLGFTVAGYGAGETHLFGHGGTLSGLWGWWPPYLCCSWGLKWNFNDIGTTYYYVEVTNTNAHATGNPAATITSNTAAVTG